MAASHRFGGNGRHRRSWKFRYTRLGKAHAVGLGPVHTIDLAEARAKARELRQRDSISARALEWTILTAARTGETIGAKWDKIDLDDKVWVVPAARMKAHREHRVPLNDRGVAILKALPRVKGDHHVFVGAKAKKGLSNMAMAELLKDMRPGVTVHGFRSCFRDWAAESTSYPREVAEQALAHTVRNAVERAYKRGDLLVKRTRLMTDWAKFLAHPAEGAKVVPMKARLG